jgi:hypothetical protein
MTHQPGGDPRCLLCCRVLKGSIVKPVSLFLAVIGAATTAFVGALSPVLASNVASLTPINGTPSSGPGGEVSYHYSYHNNCLNFPCFPPDTYRVVLYFERYYEIGEAPATVVASTPTAGAGWIHVEAYADVRGTLLDWPHSQPTTYTLTAMLAGTNPPPQPGTDATVTYTVTTVTPTFHPSPITSTPAHQGGSPASPVQARGQPATGTATSPSPEARFDVAQRLEHEREIFGTALGASCGGCVMCLRTLSPAYGGGNSPPVCLHWWLHS